MCWVDWCVHCSGYSVGHFQTLCTIFKYPALWKPVSWLWNIFRPQYLFTQPILSHDHVFTVHTIAHKVMPLVVYCMAEWETGWLFTQKIQQGATVYQNFVSYLYEAQHISGDIPPIIRSPKLHYQPLVLHMWRVDGHVVAGRCYRLATTRPSTLHVCKTRGC